MDILYNIGSLDIFRNLRILLFIIGIGMCIVGVFKLKKIISNYNYINRDITMLENLENLSDEEFILWIQEYLEKKNYYNFSHIEDEFYNVVISEKKKLVFIDRKYNILDKIEGKYIHGYCTLNDYNDILVITTSKVDKGFYRVLNENKIKFESFSREDFNRSYKDFVFNELE
ncbi:MAG: hypothetical protein ACRC6T_05010 [Sarcina sp.]